MCQKVTLSFSLQSWLTHEVEVVASVAQAKGTLQEMIEDRKVISHQLAELRNAQQDVDEQPPAKVSGAVTVLTWLFEFFMIFSLFVNLYKFDY